MPTLRSQTKKSQPEKLGSGIKRKRGGAGAKAKTSQSKKKAKTGKGKGVDGDGSAGNPSGKEVRGNRDIGVENAGTEYSEKVKAEAAEKRKAMRKANLQKGQKEGALEGQLKVHDDIPAQEAINDDPSLVDDKVVIESEKRKEGMSSAVLEKGIIYFFYRARVNVDDPKSADDVARSFIVMRPLPLGGKIEGEKGQTLPDGQNARLLLMPKKVLPKVHRDRFLVYVEKANATVKVLKENFIAGSEYETKTAGHHHKPAATPFGEGVYAITTTGKSTHLAYILTAPEEPGEVQKGLGLAERGSYIVNVKNPTYEGPPSTRINRKPPEFPDKIMEEFRDLRWMPLQPGLLDYEGAQFLFIGEDYGKLGKAVSDPSGDADKAAKEKGRESPLQELERLEEEIRVHHLNSDDPVFEDLGLCLEEFKSLKSSW